MELMEVNGVLEAGKVLLPSQDNAAPLLQGGYGTPRDDGEGAVLSPWESLYLLAEHRLKVRDGATGEALAFPVLLGKVRALDPDVWTKYLI